MKIVSLRSFRLGVGTLAEPSLVARQEKGGLVIIGLWTPRAFMPPGAVEMASRSGPVSVPDSEEVIPAKRPFRPAPKPNHRR